MDEMPPTRFANRASRVTIIIITVLKLVQQHAVFGVKLLLGLLGLPSPLGKICVFAFFFASASTFLFLPWGKGYL
jgi:hypothetical protein